jgi:hypothetical protein
MPKRIVVLAYALFGFALLLAGVAVIGAVLVGLDRETLWSSFLITNTAIGLSAAPCGLLIARAKPDNPIGWLFLLVLGRLLLFAVDLAALPDGEAGEPTLGRAVLADSRQRRPRQHVRGPDT